MANGPADAVIIKKVKKVVGGGHHGGAWKVAYADFVTAMMAFFMLMWLLNATSEEQRKGLADYFAPTLPISDVSAGGSSMFGGETMFVSEEMVSSGQGGATKSRESSDAEGEPATAAEEKEVFDFLAAGRASAPTAAETESARDDAQAPPPPAEPRAPTPDEALAAEEARRSSEAAEVEAAFRALEASAEGNALLDHLSLKITPDGLMIEIVETAGDPLFASGSADPSELMRKLVGVVAPIIGELANDLAIVGHTDARAYADASRYTNWDLSADRAAAARRLLVEAGLPEGRVARITGAADREPLSDDRYAPENRRIAITLLRESRLPPALDPAPSEPAPTEPATPAAPAAAD